MKEADTVDLKLSISSIPNSLLSTLSFHLTSFIMSSGTVESRIDAMKVAASAVANPKKLSGLDLYSRFAFAGAVCCSVTHGAFTPVDV